LFDSDGFQIAQPEGTESSRRMILVAVGILHHLNPEWRPDKCCAPLRGNHGAWQCAAGFKLSGSGKPDGEAGLAVTASGPA
jgi:hypothetical protein